MSPDEIKAKAEAKAKAEPLCEAAKEGNATKLLHLAQQEGANVNYKDPDDVSEGGRECAGTADKTLSVSVEYKQINTCGSPLELRCHVLITLIHFL